MTSDDQHQRLIEDQSDSGFHAVMDSIDRLTAEERAALALQADQAEFGYEAYALALELLEQGHRERALCWLRTAARHHVAGAQRALLPRGVPTAAPDDVRPLPAPADTVPLTPPLERVAADSSDAPPADAEPTASAGTPLRPRLSPVAQRIALGVRLRELRESKQINCHQVAAALHWSAAKISRMERGQVAFKDQAVRELLTLYGVHDPDVRQAFQESARAANERDWWSDYGDIMPPWLQTQFALERSAIHIHTFEVQFIPGLLQTAKYAEAVTRIGDPLASETAIDRRVELRMRRQEFLSTPEAPKVWAILDEGVLRREVGGPDVMREQLRHLIQVSELPNIRLQILPFQAGGHAAIGAPVTIMQFAEPELPDVVHLEQLSGAIYLDKADEVESYRGAMDRLVAYAETPLASGEYLSRLVEDPDHAADDDSPNVVPAVQERAYTRFMERLTNKALQPSDTEEFIGNMIASHS
ncbi:helix-turn-helix domain-containing protein [Streptomyces sp. NPDC059398]|uniref:helix-turn-helix domain-containing protein n=1 Tax=Streptomyces sp. NPDC059398 TaxID=3346820 RepID=UPI00368F63BA